MKKVHVLSNFAKLGMAALIGAAPIPVSAQAVAASASRAATSGAVVGAAALPALPVLGAPLASALAPSLSVLTPLLAVASVVPAPAVVGAPATLSARSTAERMKDATSVLGAMPDLSKASSAQAHDAGRSLEAALTGERLAAAAAAGLLSAASTPDATPRAGLSSPGFDSGVTAELAAAVKAKEAVVKNIRAEIAKVIVGQTEMVDSIITAMIAGEHVLLEGVPGVAKTQTVKAFSDAVEGQFQRVQGTPDKLPSDLLGAEILQEDPGTGVKAIKLEKGPVFTNILLVDEINRMMPKTQAALLEAMAEGRVTIGRNSLDLPKPFLVLATQNPIEQEGVYRLPEAQQDRFMYKVLVPRPNMSELQEIMERFSRKENQPKAAKVTNLDELVAIRRLAEQIHVDEAIKSYIVNLVEATHNPAKYGIDAKDAIESGASPRAGIFLLKAAKINALLNGRAWVGPNDVREVAARVLRHRLILSYQAHNLTTDQVVESILNKVPVPKPRTFISAALRQAPNGMRLDPPAN